MSLILNPEDWEEIYQQAEQPQANSSTLDDFEQLRQVPRCIGRGYGRKIELSPGVCLYFFDCEYHQDLVLKTPVHRHPIQILIPLSGFFLQRYLSHF